MCIPTCSMSCKQSKCAKSGPKVPKDAQSSELIFKNAHDYQPVKVIVSKDHLNWLGQTSEQYRKVKKSVKNTGISSFLIFFFKFFVVSAKLGKSCLS